MFPHLVGSPFHDISMCHIQNSKYVLFYIHVHIHILHIFDRLMYIWNFYQTKHRTLAVTFAIWIGEAASSSSSSDGKKSKPGVSKLPQALGSLRHSKSIQLVQKETRWNPTSFKHLICDGQHVLDPVRLPWCCNTSFLVIFWMCGRWFALSLSLSLL